MDSTSRKKRAASKRKITEDFCDEVNSIEAPKAKKAKCKETAPKKPASNAKKTSASKQKTKTVPSKAKPKNTVDEKELALRAAFKGVRGRRGILQSVMEMPEDILCEIFSSLTPIDLLRLSRTSKDLRAFLGSRIHSENIWRAAREGMINLPPSLPRDLSEPAYASFVFETHCQKCGAAVAEYVDWLYHARFCGHCVLVSESDPGLKSLRHADILFANIPKIIGPSHLGGVYFFNIQVCDSLKRKISRLKDDNKCKIFVDQWAKEQQIANMDALKVKKYIEREAVSKPLARSAELAALRKRRLDAIVARLEAQGWSEDLTPEVRKSLEKHASVNQPRALTDRIWKNIEPAMLEFMEAAKSKRLRPPSLTHPRVKVLDRFYNTMLDDDGPCFRAPYPPIGHVIANCSPIRELVKDKHLLEDMSDRAIYKVLRKNIYSIAVDWREDQARRLKRILIAGGLEPVLNSALSAFHCAEERCKHTTLFYPDVLRHPCCIQRMKGTWGAKTYSTEKLSAAPASHVNKIRTIIEKCGMDPETATVDEMNRLDVFLACKICKKRGWNDCPFWDRDFSPRTWAMRWRTAVAHCHLNEDQPTFFLIKNAKHLEKAHEMEQRKSESCRVMCRHCDCDFVFGKDSAAKRIDHLEDGVHFFDHYREEDGWSNHWVSLPDDAAVFSFVYCVAKVETS
ncbi:hypothetical protein CYLTODRAFT_490478 [Cylindrobasidium torrendii FP15055 ss-10]|uniref:F-box domain-containing protein n=1 Tax=Cylindrobasidium torrendii FP15055 ss-10 TaxID=1314674 RepID=A0A0D7BAU3_9AGAR|nr:hypothetical protein CYLTODRAFT_490478 [Cylindrobasidium torrendii FP15055 ss-10]